MYKMGYLLEEKALGDDHDHHQYEYCMDSLEGSVFVFFEEENTDAESDRSFQGAWDDYESESNDSRDPMAMERILYWESQEALLQEILERSNLTGSKLRQEISRTIKQAKVTDYCSCPKPSSNGCTNCLRPKVVNLLCNKGFNATLCTSKWKHTKKIPGGTHEYIEVIASTTGRKKQIPFLIELEFREQFEIAKACDEYRKLIAELPEYYIGKPDYLNAIVRILCDAAKKSMKEKKLHMGPWRKKSFMVMKWSNSFERKSFDESSNKLLSSRQAHEGCFQFSATPAVVVT